MAPISRLVHLLGTPHHGPNNLVDEFFFGRAGGLQGIRDSKKETRPAQQSTADNCSIKGLA